MGGHHHPMLVVGECNNHVYHIKINYLIFFFLYLSYVYNINDFDMFFIYNVILSIFNLISHHHFSFFYVLR